MEIREEMLKFLEESTPGQTIIFRIENGAAESIYASPTMQELNGMTRQEFEATLRNSAASLVVESDLPALCDAIHRLILEGGTLDHYHRVQHKIRGWEWVHVKARIIGELAGAPVLYCLYTDASVETGVYQNIINSSRRAAYVCDRRTFEILYINKAALTLGHAGSVCAPGMTCHQFFYGRDRQCEYCMHRAGDSYTARKRRNADRGTWESISSEPIEWRGHDAFVEYVDDITESEDLQIQLQAALDREQQQFRRSMQDVLAANPRALCAFQLNLSRNQCGEGHGASLHGVRKLQSDSADGFFANVASALVDESERRRFSSRFNRQKLLNDFAEGISAEQIEYRRRDENGRIFWARTHLHLMKDPHSGDIEAVAYSLNIDDEKMRENIFHILTSREYDLVALLHPATGEFESYYIGDTLPQAYREIFTRPGDKCSAVWLARHAVATWVDPEEKDTYLKNVEIAGMIAELQKNCSCKVTVRCHFPDGIMYRRIQHYYADDSHDTILVVESDVTGEYHRQQRQIELARSRADFAVDTINSIADGVNILLLPDPEHAQVEFINNRMYRLLGLEPPKDNSLRSGFDADNELIRSYVANAFSGVHADDLDKVKQTFSSHYGEKHFSPGTYRLKCADGSYRWFSVEMDLREQRPDSKVYYATYRDVQEEVRLQSELSKQLAEERRLRQAADAANKAKTVFLSRMSHDIRTPLNGIIGMTSIAAGQHNSPRTADCLTKVDTSSKFLLGLVNDVLDMASMESDTMELHPEPYPLEIFKGYIDAVIRPLCQEKEQKFSTEIDCDPGLCIPMVDTLRVNQIFFNLFSNAVKYTHERGTITLRLKAKRAPGGGTFDAVIADNGIGMSAEFLRTLFDPFTQEHRRETDAKRGTGLGLTIVKRLVDLMGGTISVESEQGKGSTFTLHLPFACSAFPAEPAENADFSALSGKHVLLCEDHPLNQEIAQVILEEKGMVVAIAENGQRGVTAFERSSTGYFDIILMDIHMPVMDGYQATRAIRALPRADARTVKILAMTADAFAEDVRQCLAAGMDGHIAKPVVPAALYEKLIEHLK